MAVCGECGGALNKEKKGCRRCERLKRVEIVPNSPLRERYLKMDRGQGANTLIGVCRVMQQHGFPYVRTQRGLESPDSTRLRRQLGLTRTSLDRRSGNPGMFKQYIGYDEAVALSRALGMAPHEAGV